MSQQIAIRRSILEMLAYPRQVAMAHVDLSTCPHNGLFKAMDSHCKHCRKNYECDWLNSTDDFSDLSRRPMEYLYSALTFGVDFVDAKNALAYHDEDTCECDTCDWLRNARLLVREYSKVSVSRQRNDH